jgi:lycopene cyclase domain-containing protein
MSFYLKLNILIIVFPLIFSFFPAFRFYRNLRPLLFSIILAGGAFIAWDMIFTAWGVWSFNPQYVAGGRIFGLPYEELLFFVTVPYSCLFLYDEIARFILDRGVAFNQAGYFILAGILMLLAALFYSKTYTAAVLFLAGLTILALALWGRRYLRSFVYWLWIAIGMVLFFIFNYFLTSLPVVTYNSLAITNVRLTTIPIEDFLYNFSLLTLYLVCYRLAKHDS